MAKPSPLASTPYFPFCRRPFREERLLAYIRREHRRGRRLTEILDDAEVRRLGGRGLAWSAVVRPEAIAAFERDVAEAIAACAPRSATVAPRA